VVFSLIASLFIVNASSPHPALAADCNAQANGDWDQAATWSCGHIPLATESVDIPAGFTVTIPALVVVDRDSDTNIDGTLTNNGRLNNSGTLTNHFSFGNFDLLDNSGTLTNDFGTLDNFATLTNGGTLTNSDTLTNHLEGTLTNFGTLTNDFGTLDNFGLLNNFRRLTNGSTLSNEGTLSNFNLAILDNQDTINNNNLVRNLCGGILRGNAFTDPPELSTCITVTPTTGLITTEAGGTADFTVELDVFPDIGTQVVLDVASLTPTEGTVNPTQLVFTRSDWNTPQTVTITGEDDGVIDGDQPYTVQVTFNAGSTTDERFSTTNMLDPDDVGVTNQDNDGPPDHAQNDEQGPPDHASEPGPPPHAQGVGPPDHARNDEKGPPEHSNAGGKNH
jgi:hypothetical protein